MTWRSVRYALFECTCNHYENGLMELVDVADLSKRIGNMERFKKCLLAFWQYRFYATPRHEEKDTQLLRTGNNPQKS